MIKRCGSEDSDFMLLVKSLDTELHKIYGELQKNYDKYNTVQFIETALIIYENEIPVGCGCFKRYNDITAELKRIYVVPEYRGKGLSKLIVKELEGWAEEEGYFKIVLETGYKQYEAMSLYYKCGYKLIVNYGQYEGLDDSICFAKDLI